MFCIFLSALCSPLHFLPCITRSFADVGTVYVNVGTRLDVYIYDYLVKRKLQATAKAFQAEAKVSSDPVGKLLSDLLKVAVSRISFP